MKVRELIEKLSTVDPDADIWVGYKNLAGANTYASLDYMLTCDFSFIENDFYGTPGNIDIRLLKGKKDDDKIVYFGTEFDIIDRELSTSSKT